MKKTIYVLFILLVSISRVSSIYAQGGDRQGFIIGADLGVGSVLLAEAGMPDVHIAPFGIDVGWLVGFAPTERLLIFMVHDLTVFDFSLIGELYEWYFDFIWSLPMPLSIGALILTSPYPLLCIPHAGSQTILGLGGRYYLEEEAPSLFVQVDSGICTIYDPLIRDMRVGLGTSLGAGYEFYPNFDLQCMLKWNLSLEGQTFGTGTSGLLNAFSLNISLGAVAY